MAVEGDTIEGIVVGGAAQLLEVEQDWPVLGADGVLLAGCVDVTGD